MAEMYRIAVCDDEKNVRDEIRNLILEWNSEVELKVFSSGEDLLENYLPYDAVFLDIDMQGMNGIETGKALRLIDREVKIVYVTAYRDYVAGAFGVHAFQYLLKPVNRREIINILEEIFRYMEISDKKIILDFHTVDGIVCLSVDTIYFFEYENRKIRIVTDKEEYYMVERIGNVAKRMENFGFSMPHQSFSVNMLHVKNVKGQHIYLDNGMEIPLSQKKQKIWKQELTAWLSARLERRGG